MTEDVRVEVEPERLALTVERGFVVAVIECAVERWDGSRETLAWREEEVEEGWRFTPRGRVLLGPQDRITWYWEEG
jgi:hypothetical protein